MGAVFGLLYGVFYVYRRRWVLRFPIVQRPLFYSFKMGISPCLKLALKLSTLSLVCSTVIVALLTDQFKGSTMGKFTIQQINSYIGISVVSFSWELSQHLLQVIHTRRSVFAPPQGSAAAEVNPSEALLDAIEQSRPKSLMQYLAYLDLCMVTESNVDPWRRAIFFEETGETYMRVVTLCLRPLKQFTSSLAESLEGSLVDKSDLFAQQLNSTMDANMDLRLHEAFNDFQLCTWCARTLSALTARSHREDMYGVAQINGCNTAVVSTLLSCLLAVEACMGKKTYVQPANLIGPASIRWATSSGLTKRDLPAAPKIRKIGSLHCVAYAMADVLRTSIYQIVCAFEADMQASAKSRALEKTWIADGKPLYGSRELLTQKLALFLEYRAT